MEAPVRVGCYRPSFMDTPPVKLFRRVLALWPVTVAWRHGPEGPEPLESPLRVWLQHVYEVRSPQWNVDGQYWLRVGFAVPEGFVRRNPRQILRHRLRGH